MVIREGTRKVQDADFRLCLLKEARKQCITHFFTDNLPDKKTVVAYVGGRAQDVDNYVKTIIEMGKGNPKGFHVEVGRYKGRIMTISDFVGYFHTEQLVKGVNVMESMGTRMGSMDTGMETLGMRMGSMDTGMETLGMRMGSMDTGMETLGMRMETLGTKMESMGMRISETLQDVGERFAETISAGFKHMDERFDRLPRDVVKELRK